MRLTVITCAFLAAILLADNAAAQTPKRAVLARPVVIDATPAATRAAEIEPITPLLVLAAPDVSEKVRLSSRTLPGGMTNAGIVRSFPRTVRVNIASPINAPTEPLRWLGAVELKEAKGVRLHLTNVKAPSGTIFWTYAPGQAAVAVKGRGEPDLWLPSVAGTIAYLEVETFGLPVSFELREAAHLTETLDLETSCLVDATCITDTQADAISLARRAVARFFVVNGSNVGTCSGSLVADRNDTNTPYFLTADHCVGSQAAASSMEIFFDFRSATCGGPVPSRSSVPRVMGATLLVASSATDVALTRLTSLPPSRVLLGWDPRATSITHGVRAYRVSHPSDGLSVYGQAFAQLRVDSAAGTCSGAARPNYIYSTTESGGSGPGSSGASLILPGGMVIGQLSGVCGSVPEQNCAATNSALDGSLAASWPLLKPYLDSSAVQPETCVPTAGTLCLNANRFAVSVNWRDHANQTGAGRAIPVKSDSGYFWFFNDANIELVIKVLDGRTVNGYFWVFYGALTDVEYTITVRDVQTGSTKNYFNARGTNASGRDVTAFR